MDETLMLLAALFLLVLAVLWLILPFALFGLKGRIDRTNLLLERLFQRQTEAVEELVRIEKRLARLQPEAGEQPPR